MAADPNKIEVGDTVSILISPTAPTLQAVVLSLPDNQLDYWRVRTIPNNAIVYVSLEVPVLQLVSKA
jgi:hypothetical protein